MIQRAKSFIRGRTSLKVVYIYGAEVLLLALLLTVSWLFDWYMKGQPDIPQLLTIFKEFTSLTAISAVTFIVVFCVDKNRDGRPDAAEKQAERPERKS